MSTIPSSWENCTLEDIAKIISGGTPKSTVKENFSETGGVAWLTPADLSGYSKKTISNGKRNLTEIGYKSCSAKKMPKGSVLYSSRAPIGYVVISENEISTNQGFKSFVPDGGIDSDYLYYYLKSIKHIAEAKATGTTFKELSGTATKALPFIAPPEKEQKRIVEKLDSLLAQVDTIQQRLNNLPNIIKRFRQSVLAAAVSGKLTEQWRGENDVANIDNTISKILEERSQKVSNRTKIPQPHLKDEEYPIPDSWKWVSLDSLASKIVDGVHHKPVYTEEGIPFMSVKDIKNEKMSFNYCKYISEETHKEIHPRCNPEKGDLLITKSGTIGRTAIIDTDAIFDLFVSVALIKPASMIVNMKFIDIALRKWVNSIDVSSRVVGTAIKNLHLRDMRVLAIPFAPIEEQTEIVRLVEQYFALADTLEKNLANAKQRVDNLTQSILAKAFKGELVPQDPSDEPADKLLERIKAARTEAEALEKAAKKVAKVRKTKTPQK